MRREIIIIALISVMLVAGCVGQNGAYTQEPSGAFDEALNAVNDFESATDPSIDPTLDDVAPEYTVN